MSDIAANLVLPWKVARRSIRKKEKKLESNARLGILADVIVT